ncbi:hypothetical protein O7634_21870 [Micromonospora sp. WMMD1120]|uniref:hypothetical protein n=1 Tax=Micromonospora sp. WMMD1120 TaxID=3016106 RepID=UPI00241759DE|nr:hypothetical protein [Micromonospora sp. WMMD1120]MDG4809403.1 hypothetical protein [Micromonospora sp. WMMD1120]
MRRRVVTLLPLLLAGATGCGPADAAPEAVSPTTVRVLVRDINIRAAGVDCAGTGPYQHFHNRASFRVLDPDGAAVASGRLPAGTAVAAVGEDLRVERVPTYCEFAVGVRVPQRTSYRLEVDGRAALDLTSDSSEGPALVAVVP